MNKYIQIYEDFLDDKIKNINDTDNEEFKNSLSEFKSRKGNLQNVIMSNINTDKDISKNVEQIVGENKYLKMYLNILNNIKILKRKELKMDILNKEIIKDKKDLNDLTKEKINLDSKQSTLDDLKGQIEKHYLDITELKKDIQNLKPTIQKLEAELNNLMKADENKIKELTKK